MRTSIAAMLLLTAPLVEGQVVESKKGPVEFIGLEERTIPQAQAMLEHLPDGDLHYCAADLKKGGFAEASVIIYVGDDRKLYTVVTVAEARRAAEVARRAAPGSTVAVPEDWAAMEVRQHTSEADFQKALEVLHDSKAAADRGAAARILANFADRDAAWRALVAGLRDPDDSVASKCAEALNGMRRRAPRTVDWGPAAEDLSAVLRGANLFALRETLQVLAATGVRPSLASALLGRGGGRLVLACLRAQHAEEHQAARALLVQLHAADLGDEPAPWEAWIASL